MNSVGGGKDNEQEFLAAVTEQQTRSISRARVLDHVVENTILRDESPEAQLGRQRRVIRAAFGEFMCTLIFFSILFSVIANGTQSGWEDFDLTYAKALVSGFQATGVIYTFSSVSGAHFNCNISFALWLTGRLSNRRCVLYIAVQLLASVVAMAVVAAMFHGDLNTLYAACAVEPEDDMRIGKVFATEFLTTFILTYVAFTVAFLDAEGEKKNTMSFKGISDSKGLTVYTSTPQSKAGFAPLAIGFTVVTLSLVGGSSGPAFNQNRMFGPAVFSGKWAYFYVYYIAELCGAAAAALIAHHLHLLSEAQEKEESIRTSTMTSTGARSKVGLSSLPSDSKGSLDTPILDDIANSSSL
jgi:glycerol uptake facilitator-like aquaporin